MLREKNVAAFSSWEKELPKFVFDPRFKILPKHGDRRTVFEQFSKNRVGEQRQERKDKLTAAKSICKQAIDDGRVNHSTTFELFKDILKKEDSFRMLVSKDKEKLYNDFVVVLKKEHDEREAALKEKAMENFKQLLKETKDIDAKTIWSKGKRDLEDDPRYEDERLTLMDKEQLFKDYILNVDESEKRRRREEIAMKEREKETQKLREKELRDRERVHQRQKENEEVTDFQILLREKIRDPEASWSKNRRVLEEDTRWLSELPMDIRENLFREHTKMLRESQSNDFRTLLADCAKVGTIDLTTTDFEQVKLKLRDDPRYEQVSPSERRAIFERFLRDLKRSFIEEFKELLTENKNEGNVSSKSSTSGPKFEKLRGLLLRDKRYSQLDAIPEEREKVLIRFIQQVLEKQENK